MNPSTNPAAALSDTALDARLAMLKRAIATQGPPRDLEAALMASFRRQHRRRPVLWWIPPLALAATVALVSWMIRGPLPPMKAAVQAKAASQAHPGEDLPFLALRPLERIALEPGTSIVATEFPRALLADWGLPVPPDRAAELVRAEMLYSADGEALAIRLVN